MPDNKFCGKCGSQLKEGVQFCTECGTKVAAEDKLDGTTSVIKNVDQFEDFEQPIESHLPPNVSKSDKGKTKLIVAIGGVVVALAIIFVIYKGFFAYPSKPDDVAVKFLNAMMVDYAADDAAKYIDMGMVSKSDIKEVCTSVKLMSVKISGIKVTRKEVEGDYAKVTFSATMSFLGQKEEEDGTISLEKIKGKWKVVDFN